MPAKPILYTPVFVMVLTNELMNRYFIFSCSIFLVLVPACKKEGCFQNSGSVVTRTRSITSFHRIDLFDNINLILSQDSVESIRIISSEHLQPHISTSIENGILTIRNNTACTWLRAPSEKIMVFLSVKKLDYVNYNGSGTITSTNMINAGTITFQSRKGAGVINIMLNAKKTVINIQEESADFVFHGKSDTCVSYSNARASIDLSDFEVKVMNIGYVGVRDATINVTDALQAIVFHTGNVYYKGKPPFVQTIYYSSGRAVQTY